MSGAQRQLNARKKNATDATKLQGTIEIVRSNEEVTLKIHLRFILSKCYIALNTKEFASRINCRVKELLYLHLIIVILYMIRTVLSLLL